MEVDGVFVADVFAALAHVTWAGYSRGSREQTRALSTSPSRREPNFQTSRGATAILLNLCDDSDPNCLVHTDQTKKERVGSNCLDMCADHGRDAAEDSA